MVYFMEKPTKMDDLGYLIVEQTQVAPNIMYFREFSGKIIDGENRKPILRWPIMIKHDPMQAWINIYYL